jgi:hypothetical protein
MAGTTVGIMLVPQVILLSSISFFFSSFAWFLRKEKKGSKRKFSRAMYGVYKSGVNYGHWFSKEIEEVNISFTSSSATKRTPPPPPPPPPALFGCWEKLFFFFFL